MTRPNTATLLLAQVALFALALALIWRDWLAAGFRAWRRKRRIRIAARRLARYRRNRP